MEKKEKEKKQLSEEEQKEISGGKVLEKKRPVVGP